MPLDLNFGFPTWPDQYGTALITQIVENVPGMTSDRVFWSTYNDQIHMDFPPADRFIALFQPYFPVDQASVSGGGEYTTKIDSQLVGKLFIRLEQDIEGRTAQWLNDQAFGAYKFIQQFVTSIHMWKGPTDPTGLALFTKPMRLLRFEVNKDNRDKDGGRWGIVTSNWEISFVADLGKPYQTVKL